MNAAAAGTMTLGWHGKRGVVRSRQGRARMAVANLFSGGRTPLAGGSVCFSRGIPTDHTGAERVLAGAVVTGADGTAGVKVRGQSSRFVRATYFAGPEQVITKRIRLNVSPAIRLGIRKTGKVEKGDTVRAVAVLRGKYKANRRIASTRRGPAATSSPATRPAPEAGRASATRPRRPASSGSTPRCPTSARTRTAAGAR